MHNFIVMRDKTADLFFASGKIEKVLNLYPDKWIPLYSMVNFTNISYSNLEAWSKTRKIMREVMQTPCIDKIWDNDEIIQVTIYCKNNTF